jgi:hypothetical protein
VVFPPHNTSQWYVQLLEFPRSSSPPQNRRLVNSLSSRVELPVRCLARSLSRQFVVFLIRPLVNSSSTRIVLRHEARVLHQPISAFFILRLPPSSLHLSYILFPLPISESPTFSNLPTFSNIPPSTIYGLTLCTGKFRSPSTLAAVRIPSIFLSPDQLLDFYYCRKTIIFSAEHPFFIPILQHHLQILLVPKTLTTSSDRFCLFTYLCI